MSLEGEKNESFQPAKTSPSLARVRGYRRRGASSRKTRSLVVSSELKERSLEIGIHKRTDGCMQRQQPTSEVQGRKVSQRENRDSLRSLCVPGRNLGTSFLGRGSRMRRLSRACNLRAIRQRSGAGVLDCNLQKRTAEAEDRGVRPGRRLFVCSGNELGCCLNA